MRLKKNNFTGQMYVNPAKGISSISKSQPFTEALFIPDYDPSDLMTCTIIGEIVGLADVHVRYCCIKCNSSVQPVKFIAKCENSKCKMVQKLEKCKKHWYIKALVESKEVSVYVIFRDEIVNKVLSYSNSTPDDISEEVINQAFLSMPTCSITYHQKTKIVKTVAPSANS